MYNELAEWWPSISAPEDYDEEAKIFADTIESLSKRPVREVLELGSGGGNNASHMKARFEMTLTDLSEDMLGVSRRLNPECEHVQGDMRTVRLERDFDAVFVHDAVCYMLNEEDVAAAITTAALHLRPGGVALFVPDDTVENYRPRTTSHGHDHGGRSARYLEWHHPYDPAGTTCTVSYALLMREGDGPVRCVYDEHVSGLFSRDTWLACIERAGLGAHVLPFEHSSFEDADGYEMFAGIKPGP